MELQQDMNTEHGRTWTPNNNLINYHNGCYTSRVSQVLQCQIAGKIYILEDGC